MWTSTLPLASEYVQTFDFIPGVNFVSTYTEVITVIALYFLVVYALKDHVKRRGKAYELTNFAIGYNLALSAMSAHLMYELVNVANDLIQNHGLWSALCDERAQHTRGPKTFMLTIIFYTKILELSDTVLLCLRGKATPFIHLYHHAITVFFAFLHLKEQTCVSWTMPIMNLAVHIVLYMYFALYDLRVNVWWKKYLTMMQVTQFYLTLVPSFAVLIPRLIYTVSPDLPLAHKCHAGWPSVYVGLPLLLSYLVLFQRLYIQNNRPAAVAPMKSSMKQSVNQSSPSMKKSMTIHENLSAADTTKRVRFNEQLAHVRMIDEPVQ